MGKESAKPMSLVPVQHRQSAGIGVLGQPSEVRYLDRSRGFKSTQVHQTISSLDGRIWSATPLGLSCYDGVRLRLFGSRDGLTSHGLRTIGVDEKNRLWLGSDVGVDVVDINGTDPVLLWHASIGTVNSSFVSAGICLFGTASGLYQWDGEQTISKIDRAEIKNTIIKDVIASASKIWMTGPEIGVLILDLKTSVIKPSSDASLIGPAGSLANGPDDTVFAGGHRGIIHINRDGNIKDTIRIKGGVSALVYRDGFIWAGASDRLIKIAIQDRGMEVVETTAKNIRASGIMFDEYDNIWISSYNKGLGRISGQRRLYDRNTDLNLGSVYCIKNGTGGNLVGSQNGLSLPDGSTSLDGIAVWDVFEDKYGKIWSATAKGLFCQVNPHYNIPYHHKDCLVLAAPCRALILFNEELFIGSIRGLARMSLDGPEEMLTDHGQNLGYVYSLHVGPKNKLWIATLGNGLWTYDGQHMTQISGVNLTQNCNVYALATLGDGSLFIAHDDMISKINSDHKMSLFAQSTETVAAWGLDVLDTGILLAGTSEGLVFYDALSGHIIRTLTGNLTTANWEFTTSRALKISHDQTNVYCGLASGLGMLNLDELSEFNKKPKASLGQALWRGVETETAAGGITAKYGKWYLEIILQTHWYIDEFACSMRVKLDGFDMDWSEPKPIGPINYTSLPIGDYALFVEITSPFAGTGPAECVYEFSVIK